MTDDPAPTIPQLRDIIAAALASALAVADTDPVAREHYANAGDLLLEAYPQLRHAEWPDWLKRHFQISVKQADKYMDMARRRRAASETGGA